MTGNSSRPASVKWYSWRGGCSLYGRRSMTPGGLQLAEPVGEDVAGRPGVAGDAGEAVHAVADLAQGQERPPLAEDVQSGGE